MQTKQKLISRTVLSLILMVILFACTPNEKSATADQTSDEKVMQEKQADYKRRLIALKNDITTELEKVDGQLAVTDEEANERLKATRKTLLDQESKVDQALEDLEDYAHDTSDDLDETWHNTLDELDDELGKVKRDLQDLLADNS
jgi:copper chaperone CopZ